MGIRNLGGNSRRRRKAEDCIPRGIGERDGGGLVGQPSQTRSIGHVHEKVWNGIASILNFEAITNVVIEDHLPEVFAGNDKPLGAADQDDLRIIVWVKKGPHVGNIRASILRDRRRIDVVRGLRPCERQRKKENSKGAAREDRAAKLECG